MLFTPNLNNADTWNAEVEDNAVTYRASLFLGRGKYANAEATTLTEIHEAAAKLQADHPHIRSQPIVSAFDAAGNKTVLSNEKPEETAPVEPMPDEAEIAPVDDAPQIEQAAPIEEARTGTKPDMAEAEQIEAAPLDIAQPVKPAKPAKGKSAKPAKKTPQAKPAKLIKAAKAIKPAKPVKIAKAPAKAEEDPTADKPAAFGKRAQIEADAANGKVPDAPDFSAATHARFRKKLDELVALVNAKDLESLKAYKINPVSSSPKALDKYRRLAVIAIAAQAAKSD